MFYWFLNAMFFFWFQYCNIKVQEVPCFFMNPAAALLIVSQNDLLILHTSKLTPVVSYEKGLSGDLYLHTEPSK